MEDITTLEHITIVDAMRQLDKAGRRILFVMDSDNKLTGSMTDGDIRRHLLSGGSIDAPVSFAMNKNVKTAKTTKEAKRLISEHRFDCVPIVDDYGRLLEFVFRSPSDIVKSDVLADIPIVIMAGGAGTRLYPYTKILPKPLIPIDGVPIIERIIEAFSAFGAQNYILSVNHMKALIRAYFSENDKEYSVEYNEEDKPLGTAGSLRLLHGKVNKPFFVSNCDILIQADYGDVYKQHLKQKNKITMVTALKQISVPYGVVHTKPGGEVESLEEKPQINFFINTGMYVLDPDILLEIPENELFHITHLMEKLIQKDMRVGTYPISEQSYMDMGQMDEMGKMIARFENKDNNRD